VGFSVGERVGAYEGSSVVGGSVVGTSVGDTVGSAVGWAVGTAVGSSVGFLVGTAVGWWVGRKVGRTVGDRDGTRVGDRDGTRVGDRDGARVGDRDGARVARRRRDGARVGERVVGVFFTAQWTVASVPLQFFATQFGHSFALDPSLFTARQWHREEDAPISMSLSRLAPSTLSSPFRRVSIGAQSAI
jgi:hypothetical protein